MIAEMFMLGQLSEKIGYFKVCLLILINVLRYLYSWRAKEMKGLLSGCLHGADFLLRAGNCEAITLSLRAPDQPFFFFFQLFFTHSQTNFLESQGDVSDW